MLGPYLMLRMVVLFGFVMVSSFGYASDDDASYSKRYLKFFNDSEDAINLTLEEACLPSYDASDSYEVQPYSWKVIEYDMTVANCIMLVPIKLGLGSRTSLFILEPLDRRYDLGSPLPSFCPITITKIDEQHCVYDLKTDCMRVFSKRL